MIEKELKRYLQGIPLIREVVGEHVYSGRIPETAKPTYSILIRRISGDRSYALAGEETVTQPILQIDLLSRHAAADVVLFKLFENCRKAINKYAAAPGQMGDVFVHTINIISETVDVPQPPVASGISWKRQRTFDIQVMHEQETTFA